LFYVGSAQPYYLGEEGVTGLFADEDLLLIAIQPDRLIAFHSGKKPLNLRAQALWDIHDVLSFGGCYYVAATGHNEILKLARDGSVVESWQFPGESDAWHVNCLSVWRGRVVFSAFGDFRNHQGYKGRTKKSGFVQDLLSGERIIIGLSQPHSLCPFGENLLLANSEEGQIVEFAPNGRKLRTFTTGGYPRGICVTEKKIYAGVSARRDDDHRSDASASLITLSPNSLTQTAPPTPIPAKEIYNIVRLHQHIKTLVAGIVKTTPEQNGEHADNTRPKQKL